MQKKLIALAIAGLSSAAFAQSNVTVYGVVANAFENVKATGADGANPNVQGRNRLSANSSYIGFKGAESLGNGLTAVFQIEQGVTTDAPSANSTTTTAQASNAWGTRDTYIGIAGAFGTLAAGNLTGPYRAIGAATDFNPGGAGIGFQGLIGQIDGIKTTSDDRTGNTVAYISPKFGNVTAVVAYSANETKTNDNTAALQQNDPLWTVGLTYDAGPLYIAFAHINAKDKVSFASVGTYTNHGQATSTNAAGTAHLGVIDATQDTLKANRLAVKYAFSQGTTVAALWDSQKVNVETVANTSVTGAGDLKRTAWALNAKHEFGANMVYAQYAKAKNLKGQIATAAALDTNSSSKQLTVGYVHNFSKRTLAQFYYTKISNDSKVAYNFYNNGLSSTGLNAGADPVGYGIGLRHSF